MDRRKEELEKKRQKLAELRRAREERRALLESQSTQSTSTTTSSVGRDRKAIDDLVALVLGERPSTPSKIAANSSDRGSDTSSELSNSRPSSANFGYSSPGTPVSATDARLSMLSTASQPAQFTPHYVAELTETQSLIADIPPLEQVVYSKEIQTTDGSLEAPEIDEEEIRRQITEEFEERERIKIAQLEEEIRKAEKEKHEEVKGLN
ncbi:hypothetical protein G6F60_012234 [Rhizopus arrhizus]|nr:hypothetical protein G6F60_012234 [Rhizopus arrhizus]